MDYFISRQLALVLSILIVNLLDVSLSATRYVPKWKKQACEIPASQNEHSHYVCDDDGEVKCLPGWTGDLCDVPKCRPGCDPMQGYCNRPGECVCKLGYYGERCNKCIPLPGCQHGHCNTSFECLCKEGWDGIFCSEPLCKLDCHLTRGYCDVPGECKCRLGWSGKTCNECQILPGCQHGLCEKPLECKCNPGWTGILCQYPLCSKTCHRERGYCRKPGECRCKVGWWGKNCEKCYPYPGCVNGSCNRPWECNCRPGWGGMLCDEELNFCESNPDTCQNGAKCISVARDDGNYRCLCREGSYGRNCENVSDFYPVSPAPVHGMKPPPVSASDTDFYGSTTPKIALNGNRTTTYIPLLSSTTVNSSTMSFGSNTMTESGSVVAAVSDTITGLTIDEDGSTESETMANLVKSTGLTTEKVSIVNATKLLDENLIRNQIYRRSKDV